MTPVPGNAHLLDVVYILDRGPQAHISDVVLAGNQQTRPSFILRETQPEVRKGLPVSEGNFLTAEGELYGLGIFDWASIHTLRPASDQTQDEVIVAVHESKRSTVEFGGGLEVIPRSGNIPVGAVALPGLPVIGLGTKFTASQKSFFGPRGSIQFDRRNMLGRAETATIALVVHGWSNAPHSITRIRISGARRGVRSSASLPRGPRRTPYSPPNWLRHRFKWKRHWTRSAREMFIFRYNFQKTDLSNVIIPDLVLPQDRHIRLSTFLGGVRTRHPRQAS